MANGFRLRRIANGFLAYGGLPHPMAYCPWPTPWPMAHPMAYLWPDGPMAYGPCMCTCMADGRWPMHDPWPIVYGLIGPWPTMAPWPYGLYGALGHGLFPAAFKVRPTFFFGVPRVWEKFQELLEREAAKSSGMFGMFSTWAKGQAIIVAEAEELGGSGEKVLYSPLSINPVR